MKPSEYLATLVRGRQYRLHVPTGTQGKFIVFDHGTAVRVSETVKTQLERQATVPLQTTFSTGETELKQVCQFTFEPAD